MRWVRSITDAHVPPRMLGLHELQELSVFGGFEQIGEGVVGVV